MADLSELFVGFSGVAVLGYLLFVLRTLPQHVGEWLLRRVTVEMTVWSTSPSFEWLSRWLSEHESSARARAVRVDHTHAPDGEGEEDALAFMPGVGAPHWMRYRGKIMSVSRGTVEGGSDRGQLTESVTLRAAFASPRFLREVLAEARESARGERMTRIHIWRENHWDTAGRRFPRRLDSVALPAGVDTLLREDMRAFLDGRDWYRRNGVPWRRGYLLDGPPGTGKTSLALALAGEYGLGVFVLSLSALADDARLNAAIANVRPRSLILLEDVDAARASRRKSDEPGVTLSGLLNALDGACSSDGVVTVMTSNEPETLDPALLRPGRVDRRIHLGPAEPEQIRTLFTRFCGHPPARPIPGGMLSTARVQEALVRARGDAVAATADLLREMETENA